MLRFLKSQLTPHYHVIEAVDGRQAFDKASQSLPDIILLDMNMPEKDGLQVCRELRQQASTREIPIIILTARADEATKLTALSAGANDFLSKPLLDLVTARSGEKPRRVSHHYQAKAHCKQNQVLETTIDQLKETETLLVQTEKMVSLGRMSAGIIHEINNPLNYATTGLFSLRNKVKHIAPGPAERSITEVLQDVEGRHQAGSRASFPISRFLLIPTPSRWLILWKSRGRPLARPSSSSSSEWKDKVQIEQKFEDKLFCCPWGGNSEQVAPESLSIWLQNTLDAIKSREV